MAIADEETLLASEERELAKWWALQIDDYQGEINHYTGLHTHTKIVRPLSAALPVSLTMELERAVRCAVRLAVYAHHG